ncbi:MAG: DUF362 domain-containing protein [Verrucomicrobia bacterium]|nr:DUF362 domain-containing protein [Kiritimatiellia bacterium]MCO6400019.1 DUF362 domain-containing protein [Verrucomicrobiota bacterium]
MEPLLDIRNRIEVALERIAPTYPPLDAAPYHPDQAFPEYTGPVGTHPNSVYTAVRNALASLGLDRAHFGTPDWNPLGDLVKPGAKIVVKPNWVLHRNEGRGGTDELITHASVIRALLDYAWKAQPAQLIAGDAPLQICDFKAMHALGFSRVAEDLIARGCPLHVKDFRRTIMRRSDDRAVVSTDLQPLDNFVLVDLGTESLLEPISSGSRKFRVTMYDPRLMRNNHRPGVHRYLVARDILEADLVVNAPKMKTHKKAGVTLALKNLVGINGNKDYLPHHRKGALNRGGDNYETASLPKWILEQALDFANIYLLGKPKLYRKFCLLAYKVLYFDKIRGKSTDVEGGWHGNDTIWRTCLDLNRVLLYADVEGKLHDTPQRVTLHLLDGVIGGKNDGPLRPDAVSSGAILASLNAVALDYFATLFMRLDPDRIAIVRHAADNRLHPLVLKSLEATRFTARSPEPFTPAPGWECIAASSAHP